MSTCCSRFGASLPIRLPRKLRSRANSCEAFATGSFGRPATFALSGVLPGADAHVRLLVSGTHSTVANRLRTPALAPKVARLQCFRGLDTHGAMVLATELADWRRFGSARELMAYFGLVPREHSSGERQRRGSITKAGNSDVRHVLVQAAWSYRFAPKVGVALKKRQAGQDPRVIAHAWKAQHRAHKVFRRLSAARPPQVAVVAVARELVGFLWAVMRDVPEPLAVA